MKRPRKRLAVNNIRLSWPVQEPVSVQSAVGRNSSSSSTSLIPATATTTATELVPMKSAPNVYSRNKRKHGINNSNNINAVQFNSKRIPSIQMCTNNNTNHKNDKDNENQLWVDKYKPTNIKDLCIAPKKINEVREWLQSFHSHPTNQHQHQHQQHNSKLLILVGSAGIGKSTMIDFLANELHFNIMEWNELHTIKSSSCTTSTSTQYYQFESQLTSFHEFLSSAALGCNINLTNTTTTKTKTKITATSSFHKSLVLIDEIPNLHTTEQENKFRQIITNYIQKSQIPTILIYSNVYEGKYKPEDLERIIDPMLLSSPIMTKIIQINPVTKAKMKQCMIRIAKCENRMNNMMINVNDGLIEEIHNQSGGDLRHAIMTLQYQFVGSNAGCGGNSYSNGNSIGMHKGNVTERSLDSKRDIRLSTFHALGKLLYAKRQQQQNSSINQNTIIGNGRSCSIMTESKSYHSSSWNTDKRPPLDFDPELSLQHSTIGLNGALNFVQFHCPDFFTSIDELNNAYSHFSDAAFLMDNNLSMVCYIYGYIVCFHNLFIFLSFFFLKRVQTSLT
jgi:cell cycle checkpoint protein